jgi:hypothetical protein
MKTAPVVALAALLMPAFALAAREPSPLYLLQVIELPEVEGRIDHMAIDLTTNRLFVTAPDANSVVVVDVKQKKQSAVIGKGLSEPHDLLVLSKKLVVTSSRNGQCVRYDLRTLKLRARMGGLNEADNIRYDPDRARIYVGFGDGAIAAIEKVRGRPKEVFELGAHPEGFELARKRSRLFVNLPALQQIAVLDLEKSSVEAHWQLKEEGGNFPMVLDEDNNRLYVGCRNPPRLLVLDAVTGAIADKKEIDGDADDMFFDKARQQVYISCASGFIDVFGNKKGKFTLIDKIPTELGAGTSLFVPAQKRLYVAVPRHGNRAARIRVYQVR